MPQISQIAATYASQIFWLLLTFGFTFLVVGLGMYPKIQGTAFARDKKIADDLEQARQANASADELEEQYRRKSNEDRAAAQALVAESKANQARESEKLVAAADAEIGVRLAAAEADLKSRIASAMTEIESVAAEAAQDMVTRLSGASSSAESAMAKVKAVMQNG